MKQLPTVILRHRKENRNKCSLTPFETNPNFIFLTYPKDSFIDLSSYFLLSMQADPLTEEDKGKGICLIDATWHYASVMEKRLLSEQNIPLRSLPKEAKSAYPRKQTHCPDPTSGLASIEALFLAYQTLHLENKNLLDHYYWREDFLEKNYNLLLSLSKN